MRTTKIFAALVALALSLGTASVFAGGPLDLNPNDPDNFTRWAAGGTNIPFNPDQGGLAGTLGHRVCLPCDWRAEVRSEVQAGA